MDWLTDVLKHLSLSRPVAGAVFTTALVLHVGPKAFPAYVDPVPKEWSFLVIAALLFSGSLLLFWTFAGAWRLLTHGTNRASRFLASRSLTEREQAVLHALAVHHPTSAFNLDTLDYEKAAISKLELVQIMRDLERKGLVRVNPYDDDVVSLTDAGRQRALEVQNMLKGRG